MNAIELLKTQHDDVKELFEKYEKLGDKATEEKQKCFFEIADKLSAHATIEEQIFYPAVKAKQTEDLLLEAVEEHLSAKRVIADLLELAPEDKVYDAKVKVLQELIEHHVEEEEGEMFKKVKGLLGAESLETMGTTMEAMFEKLMENEPRNEVPSEIDRAASV